MMHPDGTWIMTNREMTKILDFAKWSEPKPSGFLNGFWWRRKQLLDELGMGAETGEFPATNGAAQALAAITSKKT